MLKTKPRLLPAFASAILILLGTFSIAAQDKKVAPELSVSGIKLGDRSAAKEFLTGTGRRLGEDGRPTYYVYNKFATQVIKLTGASVEDPYHIMEIEVYSVGKSYRSTHTQTEKIGYFQTEGGIFIGNRESAATLIIGIPGVARGDAIGPNDVVRIKGKPTERTKTDDAETVTYRLDNVNLPVDDGRSGNYSYVAMYEFRKSRLKRFNLKLLPPTAPTVEP